MHQRFQKPLDSKTLVVESFCRKWMIKSRDVCHTDESINALE